MFEDEELVMKYGVNILELESTRWGETVCRGDRLPIDVSFELKPMCFGGSVLIGFGDIDATANADHQRSVCVCWFDASDELKKKWEEIWKKK